MEQFADIRKIIQFSVIFVEKSTDIDLFLKSFSLFFQS